MPESSKWPRASSHPHSAGPQDVLGDLLPSSQTFVCHREAFDRPRVHSFHRALAALHSFVHWLTLTLRILLEQAHQLRDDYLFIARRPIIPQQFSNCAALLAIRHHQSGKGAGKADSCWAFLGQGKRKKKERKKKDHDNAGRLISLRPPGGNMVCPDCVWPKRP